MTVGDFIICFVINGGQFTFDLALIDGSKRASNMDWIFDHLLSVKTSFSKALG